MFDYVINRLKREGMSQTSVGLADVVFEGRREHGQRSAQRRALAVAHAAEMAAFDAGEYVEIVPGTAYLGAGDYAPVVTVMRL